MKITPTAGFNTAFKAVYWFEDHKTKMFRHEISKLGLEDEFCAAISDMDTFSREHKMDIHIGKADEDTLIGFTMKNNSVQAKHSEHLTEKCQHKGHKPHWWMLNDAIAKYGELISRKKNI